MHKMFFGSSVKRFKKSSFRGFLAARLLTFRLPLFLVVLSLLSSPAYALNPLKTRNSETVLDQLSSELNPTRSELRVNIEPYGYEQISGNFSVKVMKREKEDIKKEKEVEVNIRSMIRTRLLSLLDGYAVKMGKIFGSAFNLDFATTFKIQKIIVDGAEKHFPKIGGNVTAGRENRFLDAKFTAKWIEKRIKRALGVNYSKLDEWKIHEIERILGRRLDHYLRGILNYKFLFAGFSFAPGDDKGKEVAKKLEGFYNIDKLFNPFVLNNGQITVAYLPDYDLKKRQKENRSVNLTPGSPDLKAIIESPRRIINTGIVFYYDPIMADTYPLKYDGKTYSVPHQPVWVLPNGFITINIRYLIFKPQEVIVPLGSLLSLPSDYEEGVEQGRYKTIQPPREARSEVRADHEAFDFRKIGDSAVRAAIINQQENMEAVLDRQVEMYFSGIDFEKKDLLARKVKFMLETIAFDKDLSAATLQGDVTLPLLETYKGFPRANKDFKNEIVKGTKQIQLDQLKFSDLRVPLGDILFFNPNSEQPVLEIQVKDKLYAIPAKAPVWVFPDGLLAINVSDLVKNSESILDILDAVLKVSPGHPWIFTNRSELRLAGPEKVKLPVLPAITKQEAIKSLAALGIDPYQEGVIIDAPLFKTPEGLALFLTVFAKAEIPFVVLGLDQKDPFVLSINKELKRQSRTHRLAATTDPNRAMNLLNTQISMKVKKLKGAQNPKFQRRALLSPLTSIEATRLKKQLDDISFMTPAKFIQIAAGIAVNLGFSDFVSKLQQQNLHQFLITQAA